MRLKRLIAISLFVLIGDIAIDDGSRILGTVLEHAGQGPTGTHIRNPHQMISLAKRRCGCAGTRPTSTSDVGELIRHCLRRNAAAGGYGDIDHS